MTEWILIIALWRGGAVVVPGTFESVDECKQAATSVEWFNTNWDKEWSVAIKTESKAFICAPAGDTP